MAGAGASRGNALHLPAGDEHQGIQMKTQKRERGEEKNKQTALVPSSRTEYSNHQNFRLQNLEKSKLCQAS